MKKRGVSTLIVTVLIISFTIILSVMVMTWGTSIFSSYKAKTNQESGVGLECSKVAISIKQACYIGQDVVLLLENTGQQDIASFLTRLSGSKGKIVNDTGEALGVYSQKWITPGFDTSGENVIPLRDVIGTPKSIELYPKVTYEGKEYVCDYATKMDIKSCAEIFGFKDCTDFYEVGAQEQPLTSPFCQVGKANTYNIPIPNSNLNSIKVKIPHKDISLNNNLLLLTYSLLETKTIRSKDFIIPNNKKIAGLELDTEIFSPKSNSNIVIYVLKYKDDNQNEVSIPFWKVESDDNLGSIKTDGTIDMLHSNDLGEYKPGTGVIPLEKFNQGILEYSLYGKTAWLEINVKGYGYAAVLDFCYTDSRGRCT